MFEPYITGIQLKLSTAANLETEESGQCREVGGCKRQLLTVMYMYFTSLTNFGDIGAIKAGIFQLF